MDRDKIKSVTNEVQQALAVTFNIFAEKQGGLTFDLFQGIVNGSIAAIGSLAAREADLSNEQYKELVRSTIMHFVNTFAQLRGDEAPIFEKLREKGSDA